MRLPPYLYPDRKINKDASAAYTDSLNNTFFMIFSEPIPETEDEDIVITNERYALYASSAVEKAIIDCKQIAKDTMRISGYEAIRMEYAGEYGGQDIWYCLTTVKTEVYFFQLSAWTLKRYRNTKGEDLKYAMLSFYPYR